MTSKTCDVVIIGGGISGTAAAYHLAADGFSVTLVEKNDLAAMASGWTLGGVRASGRDPAELPLALAAIERWQTLGEELDADLEYRRGGNLRLARTPAEVEIITRLVEQQMAVGLEIELLADNKAVRSVAPALADTVLAASYCPGDGHANPTATVRALAAAAERNGATMLTGTEVREITVGAGRVHGVQTDTGFIAAAAVVVAAGVYSDRLLAPPGLALPLSVQHVCVLQTQPLAPLLAPVLGAANADLAGRQQVDGRLRVTSGLGDWCWPEHELCDDDVQPQAHTLAQTVARLGAVLPAFFTVRIARVWGGLIDMTPDALPVLERAPEVDGLIVAAGFSGHGFCLGPLTGQLIAELATGREPSLSLSAFRRRRFAGQSAAPAAELFG